MAWRFFRPSEVVGAFLILLKIASNGSATPSQCLSPSDLDIFLVGSVKLIILAAGVKSGLVSGKYLVLLFNNNPTNIRDIFFIFFFFSPPHRKNWPIKK